MDKLLAGFLHGTVNHIATFFSGSKPLAKLAKLNPKPIKRFYSIIKQKAQGCTLRLSFVMNNCKISSFCQRGLKKQYREDVHRECYHALYVKFEIFINGLI